MIKVKEGIIPDLQKLTFDGKKPWRWVYSYKLQDKKLIFTFFEAKISITWCQTKQFRPWTFSWRKCSRRNWVKQTHFRCRWCKLWRLMPKQRLPNPKRDPEFQERPRHFLSEQRDLWAIVCRLQRWNQTKWNYKFHLLQLLLLD